ncbi:uncharacterized protein LOC132754736 isoform X2 [Ruditapes philippinarum]|uniref:uncharacterized protein LOC132754736 isoform X2 n=1 Tax=Ruditapes philippinarum TaxID=129788 RepID=UPI00295B0528|nr:uncharacterized protein LOC132754736 isoform X2 [Ruditapes philippinarum]
MFKMNLQVFVFVIFCVGAGLGEKAKFCDKSQSISEIRIPVEETFSQGDFDYYVAGPILKEAFFLVPNPSPFTIIADYKCRITKTGDFAYQQVCNGFDPNCNSCIEYSFPMTSESDGDKISVTIIDPNGKPVNEYYWSPCPTKYILRLQCPRHSIQERNKCARSGARMSVFLVGEMNKSSAPWTDISLDIFAKTGVKFGEIDGMNWFNVKDTGTQCDVCRR